jgi:hypothetical protein
VSLIFDKGEDVLAFASINLLALPSTQIVEVGCFGLAVPILPFSVLFALSFGVSQVLEVFGDIFLYSWGLQRD